MLLLVGVPLVAPCSRGLLSWGCITLGTAVVCFPRGRRNVAARVTCGLARDGYRESTQVDKLHHLLQVPFLGYMHNHMQHTAFCLSLTL